MTGLFVLIKRNCKLFFRDKGLFFTALITPMILLLLYVTFLGNTYKDIFISMLPEPFVFPEELLDATVASQLLSSLLSVCCVTVAFCSNSLMIQDRVTGVRRDFEVTPIKKSVFAVGYYISTAISTVAICFAATAVCFIYLAFVGWYMTITDVLLLILDVFVLAILGTSISSVVNAFVTSQGQSTAIMTIISAGYGFVCGAYMPISSFSETLRKVLSFFPGAYGTSILRNHAMRGVFEEMENAGFPSEAISAMEDSVDYNVYVFEKSLSVPVMMAVVAACALLMLVLYILINLLRAKKKR